VGKSGQTVYVVVRSRSGIRDHSDATVAGSASQQEAAVKALTANAAEISTFLISANPNSPKDTLAIRRVREMTMFIFVSICGIILFSWPAHFFLKQPDDLPTVRHR
jgi:hypothetical protein